jgi:transposase InsO family protein
MSKMVSSSFAERRLAIILLRKGNTLEEVAQMLERSPYWVWKWCRRYKEEGWVGLKDRSRAPHKHGRKLSPKIRDAVCEARQELEAEASLGVGPKYIGGPAVRTRLKSKGIVPLPSIPSIERILREANLVQEKSESAEPQITYPEISPEQPHQYCQIDIVPHFLQGGQRVSCFNAIDVVSRYPTGQPYSQRRSEDAADFLIHTWQELGIPQYTHVDNESCFRGGTTHKYVLGRVVRLALEVNTELIFSPLYHPESNGFVERFHQEYNRHVWEDTYLADITEVAKRSKWFFELYRDRQEHKALKGHSPRWHHHRTPPLKLKPEFTLAPTKRPLREGRIHFMRRVSPEGTVRVLNVDWVVPQFDLTQGVWVTIVLQVAGATLSIYDAAPDVEQRKCLASYPFPLKEPVLPSRRVTDLTCGISSAHEPHQKLQTAESSASAIAHAEQQTLPNDTIAPPHTGCFCHTAHFIYPIFFRCIDGI